MSELQTHPPQPNSSSLESLVAQGYAARRARNNVWALECFRDALILDSQHVGARLGYADVLRESENVGDAEKIYLAVLADKPDSVHAMLGLAGCARWRRDFQAALPYFEAAAQLDPSNRWTQHGRADMLRELKRSTEAEAAYRQVLAIEPNVYSALIGLGDLVRTRGDRAEALNHFQAASQVDPANPKAWLEIAREYRDCGELEAERAVITDLTTRLPQNPLAWIQMGRIYRQAGERRQALEAFQRAAGLNPNQHHLLLEMAEEELALGRQAEAEERLLRASEINGTKGAALVRLAGLLRAEDEAKLALALAVRAVKAKPDMIWAYCVAAHCLSDLGVPDKALTMLGSLVNVPANQKIPLGITKTSVLRRAGRIEEALNVVDATLDHAHENFALRMERARLVHSSGDKEKIQACLDEICATSSDERAQLLQLRGVVAESEWQLKKAIEYYQAAIELNSEILIAHQALSRLYLMICDIPATRRHLAAAARINAPALLRRGISSNPSQGLVGQVVDEYLLDPAALRILASSKELPPTQRIASLTALVQKNPGYTGAALTLLIAMRQAGSFRISMSSDSSSHIPARIMQYWDQPDPPSDIQDYMRTWREKNPGHSYVLFNDATAQSFLKQAHPPEVLEAYKNTRNFTSKADLFRLAYVYSEGGIYVDADDRCRLPLNQFVPPQAEFVGWHDHFGAVGNNFFGATARHPIIGLALQECVDSFNRGCRESPWLSSGPALMTRAFALALAQSGRKPSEFLERVAVLDQHDFFRGVVNCFASYKNTHRHWLKSSFGAARQPARSERLERLWAAGVKN